MQQNRVEPSLGPAGQKENVKQTAIEESVEPCSVPAVQEESVTQPAIEESVEPSSAPEVQVESVTSHSGRDCARLNLRCFGDL